MRYRRLFFACWPDESLRLAILAGRQRLFPLSGRPVEPSDLHLTLAFLGAVEESRVAQLKALAGPMSPVDLVLDRLQWWHKPRVLVAEASQAPPGLRATVDDLGAGWSGWATHVTRGPSARTSHWHGRCEASAATFSGRRCTGAWIASCW